MRVPSLSVVVWAKELRLDFFVINEREQRRRGGESQHAFFCMVVRYRFASLPAAVLVIGILPYLASCRQVRGARYEEERKTRGLRIPWGIRARNIRKKAILITMDER